MNATDNVAIDLYWLNDTSIFQINETTGILANHSLVEAGIYNLKIFVNDTSGNVINVSLRITIFDTTRPSWLEEPTNQIGNTNNGGLD